MLLFLLFLPILPVSDILQLAGVAPAVNDAVGGAWVDAESGGEGEADVAGVSEDGVEVVELRAELAEAVVKRSV